MVTAIVLGGAVASAPPAAATSRAEERMWRLINDARDEYGRRDLRLSQSLSDVARAHSRKMRSRGYIYHSKLSATVSDFSWGVAGENVGMGWSMASLHRAFMRSPGHRANVLYRSYRRVGIGVAWDGDVAFITVLFLG